jgi:N-acetylmuramoyl-L-alanine amidase
MKPKKISLSIPALLALWILVFTVGLPRVWAKPRIVLYAAHGGSDSGVKAGSEVEKEWNLKVTKILQQTFESAGFEVVMVRKKDEALSTETWTNLVNTSDALLAIVIHSERDWTGRMTGPLFVVEPPTRTDNPVNQDIQRWGMTSLAQYHASLRLAKAIASKLGVSGELSNLSDSRGITGEMLSPEGRIWCMPHQDLRFLIIPSIVLTPLFLTSSADLKKFSTNDGLQAFANGTVQGTMDFLQMPTPVPTVGR